MKRKLKQLTSCCLAMILATATVLAPWNAYSSNTAKAAAPKRVSVHDPSIEVANDGTYYVFGSHLDAAKSTNLIDWERFTNGYAATNNKLFGDLSANLKKAFAWAGEKDMDAKNFSVWAPDVFWNPEYVNKDGSKGAYLMYFCTTSTYKRSVIAYAVSQNIEGPYTFVDTLIYSGFTKDSRTDSGSKIDTKYSNTNVYDLFKDDVNKEWFAGNSYSTAYCPNAIDPTIFKDKDYDTNGKLWMTYGSWSGGIFVLEIDPATGKAKYPMTNSERDGLTVDKYFGTRIAGGYTKSGEGPYILYDKESDYYYLYVSYESLNKTGGYHMRLFRSKNPDGPYLDAAGNNAVLPSRIDNYNIGIKVMGNYTLPYMEDWAYMAPGHNSAFIDKDGQRYLIYHTRFSSSGEVHQVRVHQQFLNEQGWPVTAPYEYKGDKISKTGYATSEVIGEYALVNHGLKKNTTDVLPVKNIVLKSNGTISGDVTGTWTAKAGTYYMTIKMNNVTYSGVFFYQTADATSTAKAMTFSAIGTDNQTLWGVKKPMSMATSKSTIYAGGDKDKTAQMTLSGFSEMSYTVTYTSSKPKVASVNASGKVTAKKKGSAKITATVKYGTTTKTFSKTITVKKAYLKMSKKKATLKKGKSYTYKVKGYGLKAKSIKWKSSKKSVLTINKKTGKAKAKKPGKVTITATYKKFKVTYKVKVKK